MEGMANPNSLKMEASQRKSIFLLGWRKYNNKTLSIQPAIQAHESNPSNFYRCQSNATDERSFVDVENERQ